MPSHHGIDDAMSPTRLVSATASPTSSPSASAAGATTASWIGCRGTRSRARPPRAAPRAAPRPDGADGREVADLVRVLAGQCEAVRDANRDDVEPDRAERRPERVTDGGVGGADRRRIDPCDHLDTRIDYGRRLELAVQAANLIPHSSRSGPRRAASRRGAR